MKNSTSGAVNSLYQIYEDGLTPSKKNRGGCIIYNSSGVQIYGIKRISTSNKTVTSNLQSSSAKETFTFSDNLIFEPISGGGSEFTISRTLNVVYDPEKNGIYQISGDASGTGCNLSSTENTSLLSYTWSDSTFPGLSGVPAKFTEASREDSTGVYRDITCVYPTADIYTIVLVVHYDNS